jgi:hypothetical protein
MSTRTVTDLRLDSRIDAWLALGPMELSDRVVDRTRAEIKRTRQRRTWRPIWKPLGKPRVRLAMAFAAGALSVVLVGVGLRLAYSPISGAPSNAPTTTPPPARSPFPTRSPIPTEPIAGVSDHFFSAGTMNGGRESHTATLLTDGRVLIAGGTRQAGGGDPTRRNAKGPIDAAELYEPTTRTFTSTGSMTVPRIDHTATLLADGRVLISGGYTWSPDDAQGGVPRLASAELFDPASGTFTPTGSMQTARSGATAMRLPDDRVLIAGGSDYASVEAMTSEIYDPATGSFTAAPSLHGGKAGLSTESPVRLADGLLLILGDLGNPPAPWIETYDPISGTLGSPAAPPMDRVETATLLADGRVLVIGGKRHGASPVQLDLVAESFDSATGTLRDIATPAVDFQAYTGTRLADGRVLLLGFTGRADLDRPVGSAELFDPAAESFQAFGPLMARHGGTATLLPAGSVLILGGGPNLGGDPAYDSAELFK